MKKWISPVLCLLTAAVISGCGGGNADQSTAAVKTTGVQDVLEAGIAEAEGGAASEKDADERQSGVDENAHKPDESVSVDEAGTSSGDIDVDLTKLSSTMVYSEVYNMLNEPEQYIGKKVKMDGFFNYFHDQATDNYYYACIIKDAAACCSQGIEFVPTGQTKFPDDFPEVYDTISVVGTFDTYMEGENQYCTLRDASMTVG